MIPLGVEFVQETTVFREFGPLAGNTVRLAYDVSPPIGSLLSRQTIDADLRHYLRLGSNGLLATRFKGFKSWGSYPDFTYFGGNSELRGYDYLQFSGQNAVFANAELRFPLIEAALTPIGVIGGIRGVLFANIGGAWFDGQQSARYLHRNARTTTSATSADEVCRPVTRRSRRTPSDSLSSTRRESHRHVRSAQDHLGLPAEGRPRLVRRGPRNLRPRIPHPLRLVLAHAVQQGLGRRGVRPDGGGSDDVPEAALRGLDRLRLLRARGSWLRA